MYTMFRNGSVEVGDQAKPGESRARRNPMSKNGLITQPIEGIEAIVDILAHSERAHGSKKALGYREVLNVHTEVKDVKKKVDGKEVVEKKNWQYFELSEYKYLSYIEVKQYSEAIGRGLRDLGLKKGDVLNVYAATSVNWQLLSFACATMSLTIATAYDTLGEAGLTHALNEPECAGVFTNADLFPVLLSVLPNAPTIRFIIYDGTPKSELLEKLKAVREGVTVLTLDEVRKRGEGINIPPEEAKALQSKPSDVHCIMYTSGSMGTPKGVEITHANLAATVGSAYKLLGHSLKPDDTYLAFLPSAHILEFVVELVVYFVGMTIGYGKVKTLTDASVRNCRGDFREFRPSIMVGVPAIWETIRKGILTQVNAGSSIKRSAFHGSVKIKKAGVPVLTQLADSIVFSKVKAATGGRLRLALSGGATLSRETHEFLNNVLTVLLLGYGMTETCGMCSINPPELKDELDNVGLPVPCTEIKLLDIPELGYFTTNDPPQGEVCVRGPAVVKGYYKRPDLNSDPTIFTPDGWLRTGDVGQWNPNGTLSLIDRIKNLIKLQGGEYIALELLESTYKSCNLVHNMCVYGHPEARQPMCIVIPHEAQLRHFLKSQPQDGVDENWSIDQLCHNNTVRKLILDACNAVGRKNGFKQLEMLEAIVLTPTEWTPENGLTTAAQKLSRKAILTTFKSEIKEVYPY